MKTMFIRLGMIALVATWVATPAGAQALQYGTWTGMLTPPGGTGVPVTFEVGETQGVLSIVMNNPQLGDIPFNDATLDAGALTFWWEPGTRVDCSLLMREDRSFAGTCQDGRGPDGEGMLIMSPPAR